MPARLVVQETYDKVKRHLEQHNIAVLPMFGDQTQAIRYPDGGFQGEPGCHHSYSSGLHGWGAEGLPWGC